MANQEIARSIMYCTLQCQKARKSIYVGELRSLPDVDVADCLLGAKNRLQWWQKVVPETGFQQGCRVGARAWLELGCGQEPATAVAVGAVSETAIQQGMLLVGRGPEVG